MANDAMQITDIITLDQNGQCMSITDDAIELLGDLYGRVLLPSSRDELRLEKGWRSLLYRCDYHDSHCVRIPNAGLFSSLSLRAQQRGCRLIRRISPAIRALPEPRRLADLRHPQIACFARQETLGRIGICGGIKPEYVIIDLARAYPEAKIVVLGDRLRQLDRIVDFLRRHLIHAGCSSTGRPYVIPDDIDDDQLPQVMCMTPIGAGDLDFATADIVLVLDAYACAHDRMQLALSQVDAQFRLFGLVDLDRRSSPSPSQTDAAFAVFGPKMIDVLGSQSVRRETCVAWMSTPPPRIKCPQNDPDFARLCYWQHHRRNKQIRRLALALRSRSAVDPQVPSDVARFANNCNRPPSVTILVERPLHAAALSDLLPDWPVVISDDALRGVRGSFRHRVERLRSAWLTGEQQIVLSDAGGSFRGEITDIVIWAGGGRAAQIRRQWLGQQFGVNKPLLIVDFLDEHNRNARRLSRQRRREYNDRNMYPVGISASQGRMATFLARQPEGVEL